MSQHETVGSILERYATADYVAIVPFRLWWRPVADMLALVQSDPANLSAHRAEAQGDAATGVLAVYLVDDAGRRLEPDRPCIAIASRAYMRGFGAGLGITYSLRAQTIGDDEA